MKRFLPLFRFELARLAGKRRTYALRVAFAAVPFAFVLAAIIDAYGWWDPVGVLGYGRTLFEQAMHVGFVAIGLVVPALMSDVFSWDRDARFYSLVGVTDLSARDIVCEAMLGRLWPALTGLLATFPLVAVCYAFGGVTVTSMATGFLFLLLWCLQLGALSVLMAASFSGSTSTFLRTYVAGFFLLALPSVPLGMMTAGGVILIAPLAWGLSGLTSWTVPASAVAALLSVAFFLRLARDRFWEQMPGQAGRWSVYRGPLASAENKRLPGDEPAKWRLLGAGRDTDFSGAYYSAILVIVLSYLFLVIAALDGVLQGRALELIAYVGWLGSLTWIAVTGATAFSDERHLGTLEVLLSTPMTGPEIIAQKAFNVGRVTRLLRFGLAPAIVIEAATDADAVVPYLAASAFMLLVYPPMLGAVATWIGLHVRSRARAAGIGIAVVIAWLSVPTLMADAARAVVPLEAAAFIDLISPFTLVLWVEQDTAPIPLVAAVAFSLVVHGGLWLLARSALNRNADRYLGRI